MEASPGQPALIYIGYDQDGEVFCNYKAINVTAEESEVEIEVEPGGKFVVLCGVHSTKTNLNLSDINKKKLGYSLF